MELFIAPDGTARCLYAEELNLAQIGRIAITRASHVEPTTDGCWTADLSPIGGPVLGPFAKRSEALEAEENWIEHCWLPNGADRGECVSQHNPAATAQSRGGRPVSAIRFELAEAHNPLEGLRGGKPVYYLYASKPGVSCKLVATFDSEQQLLAYVGWATLKQNSDGTSKFEQGSALAGYHHWEKSSTPLTKDDPVEVLHNPSPSML